MSKIASNGDLLTAQISEVFIHWQTVFGKEKSKLSDERKKKIRARLKEGFTVVELKNAINGCFHSDFHRGENEQRKSYDELTLILRDTAHVEQFVSYLDAVKDSNVICVLCRDTKKTPRFNETGDIVGEDSCRACEWVNGSIGTKLVAMVSGNKPGMSLAKQTIVNTKQVGKYIDEELKARDGKPWTLS